MTEALEKEIAKIVRPGDLVAGKYLVDRLLGVGGMGAVVAATHTSLDQRVAIKFLLPSAMSHPETVERFQREARAAAKIKSEHVVRVSDFGTLEAGAPFIVMEFLEGRDLAQMLAVRGPLPIALAVDYLLQACEALAEAHMAGIVHRDLKPSNLFLARGADGTEQVKVLDFGISKTVAADALQSSPALTKTTDIFGSPTYMSPEQLRASRDVDARADVWALGVILHEILTGQAPFRGATIAEIFGAILHEPTPRLRATRKDAPADLERALLRSMEKDASKRFHDVGELAEALAPFGSDGARTSMSRVSRVLRTSGSHPRAAAGAAWGGRSPSDPGKAPEAVEGKSEGPGGPGTATATAWGHVRPAARPFNGRIALLAGAVVLAAASGAFLVFRLFVGPLPGSAGAAAPAAPTAEAQAAPSPSPSVSPAPSATASAPPAAAAASTPAVTPAGTASPKGTGKLAEPPASAASGRASASAAPSASTSAPLVTTTAPAATPATPPPGDDGEFGGRR